MKFILSYRYFILVIAGSLLFTGCVKQKVLNKRITLWHTDKNPYGTFFTHESLPALFPEADILVQHNRLGTQTASKDQVLKHDTYSQGKKLLFLVAISVEPDEEQMNTLQQMIAEGNQVFISSFYFSKKMLDSFSVKMDRPDSLFNGFNEFNDSMKLSVYHPVTHDEFLFQYPGYRSENYFTWYDTNYVSVLGRDGKGHPDFVRINYKNGANVYLHCEPFAFTNFFLLHKQNKGYLDMALSYIPKNIELITWAERLKQQPDGNNFSALRYIFSNPSLKWAFWLGLLYFLLIFVFESKRKQRVVPVIDPVKNSSVEFVKTIGRLYYQRRDNHNLANKMVAHFLDQVRTKYTLPTSTLDEEFISRLSDKTGFEKQTVSGLVMDIRYIADAPSITDQELMEFSKKFDQFYKQA